MAEKDTSTAHDPGQEHGPIHAPASLDVIEQAEELFRNPSYAGYEYQVYATIWVALDLVFAKQVTDELTIEPQSQEDLEATAHDPESAFPGLRASGDSFDIMFQFKTRSGAPWSSTDLAKVLTGRKEQSADKPRGRIRPLEILRANQATRYVFITNEALAESLRAHQVQDILDIPRATQLPPYTRKGYDASTQAAIAPRLRLCSGVTEEVLTTRIRDLLASHCHVPSLNHLQCLTDLREEVRKRILGYAGGRWTRTELTEAIARHDGSVAPIRAMDHYVAPRSFDLICKKLEHSHVVLIVGPWGTGKTLTAEMIAVKLRQSAASFAVVGEGLGPSQIRDHLTSPGPLLFQLRDPWGGSRLSSGADRWSTELPKLLNQAGPDKKFLITSRLDVLQSAGRNLMQDLAHHMIVIDVDDYGPEQLDEIYDGFASDLNGRARALAQEYRETALKSISRPYEIERFLVAIGSEDASKPQNVHDLIAAACNRVPFEAADLLGQYVAAFRRANSCLERLVPFTCRADGKNMSSEEVSRLLGEERADVLLCGPSGCGKTLLATQVGLEFTESGGISISVRGMDYSGNVEAMIEREVGLLIQAKAREVLSAAKALRRPLLFVVDGYNECVDSERGSLTRGLVALKRDYGGTVLITSQGPLVHGHLLATRAVEVPSTEMQTKEAIARNVLGGDVVPSALEDLLAAVGTGLEAKLIGEVGRNLDPGCSKYGLFDAYARMRLNSAQSESIRLLSQVAGRLCDRVAFSMSRRDLDRVMADVGVSHEIGLRVRESGLLIQRGDRVHFMHEMFFDAFAAEHVIRSAADQPTAVTAALALPCHAKRKALILGAIDNDLVLDQVLDGLVDSASISFCLGGECGRKAHEWAEANGAALWERLRSEALGVRFCVSSEDWHSVGFDEGTLSTWTPSEQAFLDAMSQRIAGGYYIEEALETVRIMDRKIAEEGGRLREVAQERNITFRHTLFASAYVFQRDPTPGITQIVAQLHGRWIDDTSDAVRQAVNQGVTDGSLSSGEMCLLLMLSRGRDIPAPTIARAIESHWAEAPYHLRLDLMDAAEMCRPTNPEDLDALISAIEALPPTTHLFTSTAIVQALARLGALEDFEREHIDTVREEIRQCIAGPKDNKRQSQAYGIYAAQVDHPYSGAYYQAIAELQIEDRRTFLTMAANGAHDRAFCVEVLLIDLCSLGDPTVAGSVSRWTALPPTDSVAPQDGVAAFLVAHIALARLHCPLPDNRSVVEGRAAKALAACGGILYWCNRDDLDEVSRQHGYAPLLRSLVRYVPGAALDAVRHCEWILKYRLESMPGQSPVEGSIVSRFSDEAAEISRRSLSDPTSEVGYFQYHSSADTKRNLEFAIGILAQHGSSTDLRLLRGYANDAALGTAAIAAVRAIDERLASA